MMSKTAAERQKRYRDNKRGVPVPDNGGFVYILQSGDSDYYKIGCTASRPIARVKALQTGSPVELRLYEVFYSDDMASLERDGQRKARRSHVRGEWFRLTPTEVERLAAYLAHDLTYFYYDKEEQEQAQLTHRRISSELADYEYNDVLPVEAVA